MGGEKLKMDITMIICSPVFWLYRELSISEISGYRVSIEA
jgi:hypothetical protein